jgi:hypothetical protein
MNSEHADAIAAELANAPLARQLVELDLSMGTLTGRGAAHLTRTAFPKLERLSVMESYISAGALRGLAWCPVVEDNGQQETDSYDASDRYVSHSE